MRFGTGRFKTILLVAALTMTGCLPCSAQMKADTDKDGTVSLEEAKAAALARFEKLDTDHEGTIDQKEALDLPIRKLDTDHDRTLDKDEFAAAVATAFKAADKNGDGTVDAAEFRSKAGRRLSKLIGR